MLNSLRPAVFAAGGTQCIALSIDTLNFGGKRTLTSVYSAIRNTKGRQISRDTHTPQGFIIEGSDADGTSFYFQADEKDGEVRGISILYTKGRKSQSAAVANAIVRSYQPFPSADGASPVASDTAARQLEPRQATQENWSAEVQEQQATIRLSPYSRTSERRPSPAMRHSRQIKKCWRHPTVPGSRSGMSPRAVFFEHLNISLITAVSHFIRTRDIS